MLPDRTAPLQTDEASTGAVVGPWGGVADPGGAVVACCSTLYGHPLAELLIGESLHPGGLRSTRALLDAGRLRPGTRLLDLGCGLGASACIAASEYQLDVEAVDASSTALARARERASAAGDVAIDQIEWQQADLRSIPAADDSMDAVLAECVLSTAPRDMALAEIARVLRPGGQLLLSDVQRDGAAIEGLDDHAVLGAALCVNEAWVPGELERTLPAHGLRITQRWDRSDDIIRLLDRIEGRLRIAASVAAQAGVDLDPAGAIADIDMPSARALIETVRGAVASGRLGYFAVSARLD